MICRRCEKNIPETGQTEAVKDESQAKTGKQASWEAAFEEARRNAQAFRMEPDKEKKPQEKAEEPKRETVSEQGGQPQERTYARPQEQPQPGTRAGASGQTADRTQKKSASEPFRRPQDRARTGGGETAAGEERLASLSLVFGIMSLVSTVIFPYVMIPCACAAAACGFLGRKSAKKGSATAGLVIGVIMIAFGIAFMICLAAMSPYLEELTEAFTAYIQSAQ